MSNHLKPLLSKYFNEIKPSAIRTAQIEHMKRSDGVKAINVAIGNVSLPMHPAMQLRMRNLMQAGSPFESGVVKYSATVGEKETNQAILKIIESSGFDVSKLYSQITDGGSAAMELVILGVCGEAGVDEKPLLVFDPTYTNYVSFAQRLGRKIVSVNRNLSLEGDFSAPRINDLEEMINKHHPGALLVIPYDNPTGQFYTQKEIDALARLCVKYNLWLVSDEAYRELYYVDGKAVSIWGISEENVPGISGRRISIESASKVWNACGLRIGAVVTDNQLFHQQCVAENTTNLCPNVIGQYIFAGLNDETLADLNDWYTKQRDYYRLLLSRVSDEIGEMIPNVIVSKPQAAIYLVVDLKNVVNLNFEMKDFIFWCAQKGEVEIEGEKMTLLVSPMRGFYNNPILGRTQMRIACVETEEKMGLVPRLLKELLEEYKKTRI